MNDLIKDRDERTKKRKKIKRKMDELIGLSYHDEDKNAISMSVSIAKFSDKTVRLLDEGFIDNGFVIKKGTMEKFLNGKNEYVRGWEFADDEWTQTDVLNLTDDFTGTVNLGHMDFATFPFIIGEWDKSDLSLEDIGNDRNGLNVNLRLDENSVFVKELKRQPYDIGVSAEFWYHENETDTEKLSEMLGYYMPVIDEIFIFAYGLVGECGNVNSSGLELKGGFNMKGIKKNEIELDVEPTEKPERTAKTLADDTASEDAAELAEDGDAEVTDMQETDLTDSDDEEAETETDDAEEADGEEVADEEDADEEADGEEAYKDVEAYISSLEEQVESLTAENAELKKSNRRLNKKLKNELSKKESFVSKFSNMVEGMEEETKPEVKKSSNYISGDGIGE